MAGPELAGPAIILTALLRGYMQGIKATGLGGGSSLDVEGLVDKLVTAEGAPVQNRLDRQEAEVQTNISALGTFRGALADFQDSIGSLRHPEDFSKVAASSSDEEKVAITASNEAQSGNYSIQVLQLAQSQRLTSAAFKSDIDPVGAGNLSFQFGRLNPDNGQFIVNEKAPVKNIQITDENNSLRGVVQSINDADFGVHASLINDGNGYRVTLSTEATGEINGLRVVVNDQDSTDGDTRGLSRLSYDPANPTAMNLIETGKAADSVVLLDGIQIASPSNSIDEAITGVSLKLNGLTGETPVQLSTQLDKAGIKESIANFVGVYNEMMATIQTISGYDPETGKGGPLSGDSSVRGIAEQIRRVMGASYNGVNEDFGSLASIGIDTNRDGSLEINDSKLDSAIEENLDQVTKLFARAGSTTDSLLRFVSADKDAAMGSHEVVITQLASQGQYIGADIGQANDLSVNAGENKLVVRVDGVTSGTIKLAAGRYDSGEALAEELQRQINKDTVLKREGASVSVEYILGQFVIESNSKGSRSRLDVLSAEDSIRDLGIDPAEGISGQDVAGRIGRLPAEGHGDMLKGAGEAKGINIEVLGGKTGKRGTVSFSTGVAEQLSSNLNLYIGNEGLLQSRSNGLNRQIEDINQQRERLGRRLAVSEERLLKKYNNLDATLGRMRSTSEYLSNQLAALPGAQKKEKK
ncbi:MAG: flagellar filament capping protein FliD [Thioalkalispiraceae bacterium]|jgi:flagellar hook-associated protein 2